MKMKNLGIEKWFVDDGISGTIRDRKALNEMIDYVRDIDTVYVVALDRLSRNTKDLEEIQAKIKAKGATILPLDILEKLGMKDIPSDITSKLIFDIMTVVSSFLC
ncbi:resolvase, N-terminal domain protein [Enterococcus italicus DSM 15952]|uniref:Resolvase, N-terminal domain protein n=1 Tax=Enterococcus italicus (strain DSM 15952 / CCUG 50447 / LMG 22039 / TP 1.5) TaxID=888064 RepID=E6LJ50_ENTI1|nr:recombinase family protein [Enterococcus italicus]EFU72772.1 resolvase, N-terminal domain protein [Enterococcus italicus DSM 15952]